MTVKLLTEHHLEFLSLKGGCTGSSESTLIKMPYCWKSHVAAQLWYNTSKTLARTSRPITTRHVMSLGIGSHHSYFKLWPCDDNVLYYAKVNSLASYCTHVSDSGLQRPSCISVDYICLNISYQCLMRFCCILIYINYFV